MDKKSYNKQYYEKNKQYWTEHRRENPEKYAAAQQKWRNHNKDKIQEWYEKNPDRIKSYAERAASRHREAATSEEYLKERASYKRRWRLENPEKYILNSVRTRARRSKKEFDLTIDDIVIPKKCPVLGIPISMTAEKNSDNLPSIDRFDNSKGYIKGNVNIISRRANSLKRDSTIEEVAFLFEWLLDNDVNP